MAMRRSGGVGRILAFVLIAVAVLFVGSARTAAAAVPWRTGGLDQALAEARESGKMVLIYVHAAHCGQCKVMAAEFWDTPEGERFVENLIPIRIDSVSPAGKDLQRRHPVMGLPLTIFLDSNGEETDRVGYESKEKFLAEAEPLRDGYEPLPAMESAMKAHPDSLDLVAPVLDMYLNRGREAEAAALLDKVMRLDPLNRRMKAEKALNQMARYYTFAKGDYIKAAEYYRITLDRYPSSTTASAAVKGSVEAAAMQGPAQLQQWKTWICGIAEKQPKNGRLLHSIAMEAHKYKLKDPCLEKAARTSMALGTSPAWMDTVATSLGRMGGR